MPPVKKFKLSKTHGEALECVCAVCWRKMSGLRPVNDSVEELIQKHRNSEYSVSSGIYPVAVCDGCRRALRDKDKVQILLQEINNFCLLTMKTNNDGV